VSDARTDFFASASKSAPPAQSRDDFFSGKVDTSEPKKPPNFSAPYAYFDSDTRRAAGIKDADLTPLQEVAPGFNRGVTSLLGLPIDTATSAADLLGIGYGTAAAAITGKPAGEFFTPYDRSQVPLTGDWFSQKLDSTPLGPVTQMVNPTNAGHRIVYNTAAGVPSGLAGGEGAMAPTLAGSGAGAVAAEAGADPATQAVASLLASHGASKLMDPLSPSQEREEKEPSPQEKLDAAASKQSMGAAGAAVDLQKLSPGLRAAVEKAVQQTGGAVNPEVLARSVQADSLPVPVRLSPGQKMGDARTISEERNARGAMPGVAEGFEAQNKALTENLRAFRDTAGENVFSTNPVEHGDTLIARYKAIDDARNADIGAKYKALEDAAGGSFPVDTAALRTNAMAALKKKLATNNAPPDVMAALDEHAASGKMSLEDFESLRSSLAREQRSNSKGEVRFAAGVIRNEIEKLPLLPEAAKLKGIADAARASSRERFEALDADPAYKAAVDETVAPDKFVQKFVINGARDDVAKLSQAMGPDETAAQTLKVATIDHLRQAAGIDQGFNGKFSQAGYNKALRALEPKLGSLVDPQLAEHMQNLGDVARYSQFQPEGSFVNNSNTFVAAAAAKGADVLEGAANLKAGGIPIGTWVRKNITDRQGRKMAEQMFSPGSGLTKLSEIAKLKEPK
jgi:hypothetical protein